MSVISAPIQENECSENNQIPETISVYKRKTTYKKKRIEKSEGLEALLVAASKRKEEFIIALVKEAVSAVYRNDFRTVYRITKELACDGDSFVCRVRDFNGRLHSS